MKARYRMFRRRGYFYFQDSITGTQKTLGTSDNLLYEPRECNGIWSVALGDTQTFCVNYGWWASGLWVAFSTFLFSTGWWLSKHKASTFGLALVGCAVVWLVSTSISDHSHRPCPILIPIFLFLSILLFVSLQEKVPPLSVFALGALTGFFAGAFVPPLIGAYLCLKDENYITFHQTKDCKWWEVIPRTGGKSVNLIIASPGSLPSCSAFVRTMTSLGYSLKVTQGPFTPFPASHWMVSQYKEKAGILIGVECMAPATVLAAGLIGHDIPIITWGSSIENPVLDPYIDQLYTKRLTSWWAYYIDTGSKSEDEKYFKLRAIPPSEWLVVSHGSEREWKTGDFISKHVVENHPLFK